MPDLYLFLFNSFFLEFLEGLYSCSTSTAGGFLFLFLVLSSIVLYSTLYLSLYIFLLVSTGNV